MSAAVALLASWFYVTIMHEVAHLIVVRRRGGKEIGFYPFWHWVYLPNPRVWYVPWMPPPKGHRRFYFARYSYVGEEPKGPHSLQDAAPLIMDACTFVVGGALLAATGSWLWAIPPACACVDACVWVRGYFWGGPHTDGYKYRYGRG
jgi:hypothetical protein